MFLKVFCTSYLRLRLTLFVEATLFFLFPIGFSRKMGNFYKRVGHNLRVTIVQETLLNVDSSKEMFIIWRRSHSEDQQWIKLLWFKKKKEPWTPRDSGWSHRRRYWCRWSNRRQRRSRPAWRSPWCPSPCPPTLRCSWCNPLKIH